MPAARPLLIRLTFVGALAALGACTVAPEGQEIFDPYEGGNRAVHEFNKDVDSALLKPAAETYGAVVPEDARAGLSNAARNLAAPRSILNFVLQGELGAAAEKTGAFVLNSTFGVFGLIDLAGAHDFGTDTTDFGETLAVIGAPEGAYQELPLLGPSTERHTFGRIVDFVINPVGQVASETVQAFSTTARAGQILGDRYQFGATIDGILYESADSYAQSRTLYLQNRRFALGVPEDQEDPFGDLEDLYDDLYQ